MVRIYDVLTETDLGLISEDHLFETLVDITAEPELTANLVDLFLAGHPSTAHQDYLGLELTFENQV